MAMIETRHEVYGRVLVDAGQLASGDRFVKVRLLNERDGLPNEITVGKAALKDKGGYKAPKRAVGSRVEKYLPLIAPIVKANLRAGEEWEELYAIGALGLVEADARFNQLEHSGFVSYARLYIMGYIKNHQNRNTGPDTVSVDFSDEEYSVFAAPDKRPSEVMEALVRALPDMTAQQQRVMKMLYVEGRNQQAVANIMNVDRISVLGLRDRALARVKARLEH